MTCFRGECKGCPSFGLGTQQWQMCGPHHRLSSAWWHHKRYVELRPSPACDKTFQNIPGTANAPSGLLSESGARPREILDEREISPLQEQKKLSYRGRKHAVAKVTGKAVYAASLQLLVHTVGTSRALLLSTPGISAGGGT